MLSMKQLIGSVQTSNWMTAMGYIIRSRDGTG
jgi:hypothetical protein